MNTSKYITTKIIGVKKGIYDGFRSSIVNVNCFEVTKGVNFHRLLTNTGSLNFLPMLYLIFKAMILCIYIYRIIFQF